jgi:CHASE3 domain sensor protein
MRPGDTKAVDVDAVQFSRTLRRAILLPVCAILLTALALLLLGFEFVEAVKKSDHSRQVEIQTERCERVLLNAETGVRGFLLQGNPAFLDPYQEAIETIDGDFDKLKNLVGGNRDSASLAEQLIQAKNIWLQHAKISVDQRRHGKFPTATGTRWARS